MKPQGTFSLKKSIGKTNVQKKTIKHNKSTLSDGSSENANDQKSHAYAEGQNALK